MDESWIEIYDLEKKHGFYLQKTIASYALYWSLNH